MSEVMRRNRKIVRRYKRDTDEMELDVSISRGRTFTTRIPDGIPYDDVDADRIERMLFGLTPPPDEVQMPVPSGLGDLVCDDISVTYWDDPRDDVDIAADLEACIKEGLIQRAFHEYDYAD